MSPSAPRILLAVAALVFAGGAALHAAVFFKAAGARLDAAGLGPLMLGEVKTLWLADSTTLGALALICGYLAARPAAAGRDVVLLVALVPAGTTALLYAFLGGFFAAHLLALATAMVVAAGLMTPARRLASA
ncbi:MAG TPA: hypothetical protein VFH92_10875 [Phenylobacterium sp.]|nr:hypothetical protein [Phenylobacterium sp.]